VKPLWEGGRHASNGRPNNGNQPAASLCGLAPKCKLLVYEDWCIEDWITYLEREHARLGGGAVGAHMLRCFRAYNTTPSSFAPDMTKTVFERGSREIHS